ncbi:hypothetical protein ACBR40_14955 [Nonomuraea sp. AD125B]|uniref:hypothetical protein n=1 Tax=Nonomuraea sp. AD125B TaxID=3242897 RepID=UPI003528AE36
MRRRVLIGGGAVLAMAALVGLGIYFNRVGLDDADKLASVIGLFVAVAGLTMSGYGLVADKRGGGGMQSRSSTHPEQPAKATDDGAKGSSDTDGAHNVHQRASAEGTGRVYQAGRDQIINER